LDEIEQDTRLHRKSIIRILNERLSRTKRATQRGPTYGADIEDVVKKISKALDHTCAERLKPNLVSTGKHIMSHQQLYINEAMIKKLEAIRPSTLKRMLVNTNKSQEKIANKRFPKRKRISLKEAYPMWKIHYDTPDPGHFEVDLVLHCDEDNSGEYIYTIQMIDVATGWIEI